MSEVKVRERCPACGNESLMIDSAGLLICTLMPSRVGGPGCPDPTAAHDRLAVPATDSPDREPDAWLWRDKLYTPQDWERAQEHGEFVTLDVVDDRRIPLYRNPPAPKPGSLLFDYLLPALSSAIGTERNAATPDERRAAQDETDMAFAAALDASLYPPDRSDGLREALERMATATEALANEAARAVCEPRLFHENYQEWQQQLGTAAAQARHVAAAARLALKAESK